MSPGSPQASLIFAQHVLIFALGGASYSANELSGGLMSGRASGADRYLLGHIFHTDSKFWEKVMLSFGLS